jgi:polyisoprenoid-binding protein YceI
MSATATKTVWNVDTMHSEVQFKVRHLVISTVTGSFGQYAGTIESNGDNFEGAEARLSAEVNSISTGVADRDAHLKSGDFFDAGQFPQITMNGTFVNKGGSLKLEGPLTIKDTTKQVSLDVDFGGTMKDGYGQHKAGFEISGKINRKEFGLNWNQVTEAGGVVVSDEVKILFNVQFTQA